MVVGVVLSGAEVVVSVVGRALPSDVTLTEAAATAEECGGTDCTWAAPTVVRRDSKSLSYCALISAATFNLERWSILCQAAGEICRGRAPFLTGHELTPGIQMKPLESAAVLSPTSVSSALQGKVLRALVEEEGDVVVTSAAAVVVDRETSEARGVSTPAWIGGSTFGGAEDDEEDVG